jgi:hypothetical protein
LEESDFAPSVSRRHFTKLSLRKNAIIRPPLIVFHPTELCEQDSDIQSENASFAKNAFSNCVGNEQPVAVAAKQQVRHYHTC